MNGGSTLWGPANVPGASTDPPHRLVEDARRKAATWAEEPRDLRKVEGRDRERWRENDREKELAQLPGRCGLQTKPNSDLKIGYFGKQLGARKDAKDKKPSR